MPIGGLKEKTMAAYRAGMKTVIVPAENEPDLQDIEPVVRENVEFVIAETMDTVLDTALRREKSESAKPATILPESVAQTLIEERRGNDDLHMYALAPDVPERVAIAVTNRNAGQETARLTDEVIRLLKLWLAGEDV